jgi:hypothetical protein
VQVEMHTEEAVTPTQFCGVLRHGLKAHQEG